MDGYYKCYNGCPNDDLKALWDAQDDAKKRLKEINPDAKATYHYPTGCHPHGWIVHEWGKEITGRFHSNMITAINEAIEVMTIGGVIGHA